MSAFPELAETLADAVEVTDTQLIVDLVDGRRVLVPLAWFPTLLGATPEQRSHLELIGDGEGIHWPDIDADISVSGLLFGLRESAATGC
jgi:hypothetical protein